MILRLVALAFITTILSNNAQAQTDLETLTSWLEGSFNSEEQAKADSDYFHITLEMKQIWQNLEDGKWFYVEQAVAIKRDKPYRQRIYHLTQNGKKITSEIYTLPNPLRFVGEWKKEKPLATLTPDSLTVREGCAMIMERKDSETFVGSTNGKDCKSNLRGASYATSEATISEEKLVSWDRGFNTKDEHIWGAEKGGYIFMKIKN
ncbi:MAG: hypothetical protein DWQ06_00060 [Calditrichaeota bacterium]|nr:MAG: hypothetical protein DWQ06_00060 [Calditrichota bacterium]